MAKIHQIDNHLIKRYQQENEALKALIHDWMNLARQGMGEEEERTFTVEEMFEEYDVLMSRSLEMLGEGGQSSHDTNTHKATNQRRNLPQGSTSSYSQTGNTIA